jgi:hypothetical protein
VALGGIVGSAWQMRFDFCTFHKQASGHNPAERKKQHVTKEDVSKS